MIFFFDALEMFDALPSVSIHEYRKAMRYDESSNCSVYTLDKNMMYKLLDSNGTYYIICYCWKFNHWSVSSKRCFLSDPDHYLERSRFKFENNIP